MAMADPKRSNLLMGRLKSVLIALMRLYPTNATRSAPPTLAAPVLGPECPSLKPVFAPGLTLPTGDRRTAVGLPPARLVGSDPSSSSVMPSPSGPV